MERYVANFEMDQIDTFTLSSFDEADKILSINNDYVNFKIFHNNIRSLAKNLEELKIHLQSMEIDIDCIILTETHKLPVPDIYSIKGYNMIYNEGNYNNNDGVVIFIKTEFDYQSKIESIGPFKIPRIIINFDRNTRINLIGIYRSPNSDLELFLADLDEYLRHSYLETFDYCVLAGDLNIDLNSLSENNMQYVNILSEYGFRSSINTVTRPESGTCLDHIFIKSKYSLNVMPLVVESNITDHSSIILQIIDIKKVIDKFVKIMLKSLMNKIS